MSNIKIGTCSWNYDSWVGLVYSEKCARSAEYLTEYAQHFDTVEIDSWFYKPPTPGEVHEYLERSGEALTFSCKLFQSIIPLLTSGPHERKRQYGSIPIFSLSTPSIVTYQYSNPCSHALKRSNSSLNISIATRWPRSIFSLKNRTFSFRL